MTFPCFDCTEVCCAEFRIYLFPSDLFRLSCLLGLAPEKICLPVQIGSENADHLPWSFSLGEEERFLLGLRRKRGRCLFHLSLSGSGRCGVHPNRPLACRAYPFMARKHQLSLMRQALCPGRWSLSEQERGAQLALGRRLVRESVQFEGFLETWHEECLPSIQAEESLCRNFRERFHRFLKFLPERMGKLF